MLNTLRDPSEMVVAVCVDERRAGEPRPYRDSGWFITQRRIADASSSSMIHICIVDAAGSENQDYAKHIARSIEDGRGCVWRKEGQANPAPTGNPGVWIRFLPIDSFPTGRFIPYR